MKAILSLFALALLAATAGATEATTQVTTTTTQTVTAVQPVRQVLFVRTLAPAANQVNVQVQQGRRFFGGNRTDVRVRVRQR